MKSFATVSGWLPITVLDFRITNYEQPELMILRSILMFVYLNSADILDSLVGKYCKEKNHAKYHYQTAAFHHTE
jgi:hypothetical protein